MHLYTFLKDISLAGVFFPGMGQDILHCDARCDPDRLPVADGISLEVCWDIAEFFWSQSLQKILRLESIWYHEKKSI